MSTATIALSRPTLADRVIPRTALNNALLILGGTALVTLFAQIAVPIWPVPITGQTLAVMLVGASLGAWRGTASLALYGLLGIAGVPVFSNWSHGITPSVLPSLGFVIGFVPAAALIGWLSERQWDRRPVLSILGFLGASLVPFVIGVPWLYFAMQWLGSPQTIGWAVYNGFTVFIVGGLVKWAIAAAALPVAWKLLRSLKKD
jgi:biotin transport system substrate-specific component